MTFHLEFQVFASMQQTELNIELIYARSKYLAVLLLFCILILSTKFTPNYGDSFCVLHSESRNIKIGY